ncbi:tRNA dihydrouridine(20/20a) synthase DusA [Labrys neptuniae]
MLERDFSIAPMMDWTDRHCRFFHRILSAKALLYTEMVTTGAVIHGDRQRLLGFSGEEHPIAVQLGGSNPNDLATSARICADFGYDEINLNVGCPSDRVQEGRFGACLMAEPELVGECVAAMKAAVDLPVTVKCRIGIDEQDPEVALDRITATVRAAGVDALIVHARKAWLKGLSPKENRDVPPLDYGRVYRLKEANRDLSVSINGGIKAVEEWSTHRARLDGVMVGREAYQNPEILLAVDPTLFGVAAPVADGFEAIEAMAPYIEGQLAEGVRLSSITRHMIGLFPGRPGARLYRRHLATEAVKPGAGLQVLFEAAAHVRRAIEAKAA